MTSENENGANSDPDPAQKQALDKLRQVLLRKINCPNSIARLNESSQVTHHILHFNPLSVSPRPGQFACDLSYAGFKVTGFGTKKKEARNNAADELIKHVLGNEKKEEDDIAELDKLRDLVESKPIESKSTSLSAEKPKAISKNSINTPPATVNQDKTGEASKVKVPEVSNEATTSSSKKESTAGGGVNDKEVWKECMLQLKHKEKDHVVMLAIFALNTGTGSPKYQVTDNIKNTSKKTILMKVMCTWNMFFMECEAETRLLAEQKAAFKMLNNIRSLCGLEQVPEKVALDIECIDSSEIINDEDIPEEIKSLLIKNESVLLDKKIVKSNVQKLEIFSGKLDCPVSPNYSITNVDTAGARVLVDVSCSWLTLTTLGKGNNRTLAEEEAATNMIKDILKIIGRMNRDNYDLPPPSIAKDAEPVKYLIYPSVSVAGHNSVTVTSNDYLCLQTEQYLNDVIIDFYLKYLQVGKWPDNKMLERTYIFSIYFYSRLTMKSSSSANIPKSEIMHNNVKKWTKNVNIFEKDFIVIPINECDHWFVVIICFAKSPYVKAVNDEGVITRPIMIVMDSLEDGLKNTVCSNLRTYLTLEWNAKMKTKKEFTVSNLPAFCPRIPQQSNLTDCGLYLLQFVESFYSKPFPNYISPLANMEFWFSHDSIVSKRYDIANLIQTLSNETNNKSSKTVFPDLDFGYVPPVGKKATNKSLPSATSSTSLKRKVEDESDDSKKVKKADAFDKELDSFVDWLQDY